MIIRHWLKTISLTCMVSILPFGNYIHAAPFDCKNNRCGIAIDAPYPNIVIGKIDGLPTPNQAVKLFQTAQKQGFWKIFPPDVKAFLMKVQPVSLEFEPNQSITVLATPAEIRAGFLKVGDLVRFAPHRGLREMPQPNDPYWVGIGCVTLLCPSSNHICQGGYSPGLFRLANGEQLDVSGKKLVPGGIVINTMTMLPDHFKQVVAAPKN